MPKQAVVARGGNESDDCGRQTEALKNGRERGDPVPWKCVMKAVSINVLIKASQALESPREQTAFSTHTRGPKPLSQHVNDRTFKFLPVLHCEGVRLPRGG